MCEVPLVLGDFERATRVSSRLMDQREYASTELRVSMSAQSDMTQTRRVELTLQQVCICILSIPMSAFTQVSRSTSMDDRTVNSAHHDVEC